jgi:hypothetical protein
VQVLPRWGMQEVRLPIQVSNAPVRPCGIFVQLDDLLPVTMSTEPCVVSGYAVNVPREISASKSRVESTRHLIEATRSSNVFQIHSRATIG